MFTVEVTAFELRFTTASSPLTPMYAFLPLGAMASAPARGWSGSEIGVSTASVLTFTAVRL